MFVADLSDWFDAMCLQIVSRMWCFGQSLDTQVLTCRYNITMSYHEIISFGTSNL